MRISTTCRNRIIRVLAVAFWIAVWQGVSLAVGSEILVASPARTFGALLSLLREGAFYRAVLGSLMRICAGFALALALGIALVSALPLPRQSRPARRPGKEPQTR